MVDCRCHLNFFGLLLQAWTLLPIQSHPPQLGWTFSIIRWLSSLPKLDGHAYESRDQLVRSLHSGATSELVDDFLRPKVAVRKQQRSCFYTCRAPKQANLPADGAVTVECLNLLFVSGQDAIEGGKTFHCKGGTVILPAGVRASYMLNQGSRDPFCSILVQYS